MILKSALFESIPRIKHGFSTRLGGVSKGAFATLNLDRGVGDEEASVRENRARFAMMIGLPPSAEIVQTHQVHGTALLMHHEASGQKADGIIADAPRVAVGIRTADCVPILIAALGASGSPDAVAAVHAGWRGATSGILISAVQRLESEGASRSRMRFALGPAIRRADFEVGPEVVEAARKSLGGDEPPASQRASGAWELDLLALLREHLRRLDVSSLHIDEVGGSTFSTPSLFYSHRRDRGVTGRHLAAIAID
jgi:YfiH family protein